MPLHNTHQAITLMVARLPDSGNVGLGRSFKKAPRATNATHFV